MCMRTYCKFCSELMKEVVIVPSMFVDTGVISRARFHYATMILVLSFPRQYFAR